VAHVDEDPYAQVLSQDAPHAAQRRKPPAKSAERAKKTRRPDQQPTKPPEKVETSQSASAKTPEKRPSAAAEIPRWEGSKIRISVHLDEEVLKRARGVVTFHVPVTSLSDLVTTALSNFIDQLNSQRDEPYPTVDAPLRPGRKFR
jgi:hypothetical protein